MDVLHRLRAKVSEIEWKDLVNVAIRDLRDADASRLSKALQPRRDIDPVTQQIAVLNHYVSDVDSEPEQDTPLVRYIQVGLCECRLHGNSALDGIHGTRELGQDTIACRVGDPTRMVSNQTIHDLAMSVQSAERPDLVVAHQSRVACHISGKDGDEPPFDFVLLWAHRTPGVAMLAKLSIQRISKDMHIPLGG